MTPEGLRGITWGHERGTDPVVATGARFAAERGIPVTWDVRSLQGFADASIPDLARRYDLLVYDHPHIGEIVPTGSILALDGLLDDAFIADQAANSVGPSHASYEWEGHLWGLAIDAAGHVSAHRPDLLERLGVGVPETWDDLWELDRVARPQGIHVSLPLKAVDTLATWLTLAANAGVEPYADEERILPRDVGLEQLETLERLAEMSHPDAFAWNPILLLERMATADDVIACPILFGYSNYSRPGFRRSLVQFRPVPSAGLGPRGGVIGGAGMGISAHTKQREAALEYAAYVASPEIQRTLYVESGGQPGHRAAWLDPAANELSTGFFRDTLPGLDAGYLRPRYDGALIVQNEGGDITWEHLQAGGDPNALLDRLDDLYRRSLGGIHA
jgi:multiple sugar transport system substrate-binding protein